MDQAAARRNTAVPAAAAPAVPGEDAGYMASVRSVIVADCPSIYKIPECLYPTGVVRMITYPLWCFIYAGDQVNLTKIRFPSYISILSIKNISAPLVSAGSSVLSLEHSLPSFWPGILLPAFSAIS